MRDYVLWSVLSIESCIGFSSRKRGDPTSALRLFIGDAEIAHRVQAALALPLGTRSKGTLDGVEFRGCVSDRVPSSPLAPRQRAPLLLCVDQSHAALVLLGHPA